ncbi:MAG: hypothetical protein KAR18_02090, partial [Spirochaetes bacterium]|nr:hypothetical protein [Spirochaetota bacterium]
DRDFLSLYLNPSLISMGGILAELLDYNNFFIYILTPGAAYEHRFGDRRRIGLYAKVGAMILVGGTLDGEWGGSPGLMGIDCRVGFQALLGKHFTITLEPYFLIPETGAGKVAFTWVL